MVARHALVLIAAALLAAPAAGAAPPPALSLARKARADGDHERAARLFYDVSRDAKIGDADRERGLFLFAATLRDLGLRQAALVHDAKVARGRHLPELLPRALAAVEAATLAPPFDEELIVADLIAGGDFGALPPELADFVHYWQGIDNLRRGLGAWASERFSRVSRRGHYFFATLHAASIRLLVPGRAAERVEALTSFAHRFGHLDLGAALEAMRRRGEGDLPLARAIRAVINDDGQVAVRYGKLPPGWDVSLAMLGLARIAAESGALLARARLPDEDAASLPLAYQVAIGGSPIYRRALSYEDRGPAVRAVAAKAAAVRRDRGRALHALGRLLYERERFGAAYDTLGRIPTGTELPSAVLLGRAWAKYRAGDLHRAMGLLFAFDAPVFGRLFAPERYILRGLIYRRFCQYRAAKLAARRFRRDHAAALAALRRGDAPEAVPLIREAALRRGEARNLFLLRRELSREREILGGLSDLARSPAGAHLARVYRLRLADVSRRLEAALARSAAEVAAELLDAEEQANLLEYEVGQAVFQRVSSGAGKRVRRPRPKVPLGSRRAYYRFEGEYWTDELGRYRFDIEDRCVD